MSEYFNILGGINVRKLNDRLFEYNLKEKGKEEDTIILMSPETFRELEIDAKSLCTEIKGIRNGVVYKYSGHKVFTDPSMHYGDIELR